MYCPKCATQNVDDAKFCRACGADISLVPHALTGHLVEQQTISGDDSGEGRSRRRHKKEKTPTLEGGIETIAVGIAFFLISFAVLYFMPGGRVWWFWMLIPAFACAGSGIGQVLRARSEQPQQLASAPAPALNALPNAAPRLNELPPRNTSEFQRPPASVTEGTTRHLNATPAARPLNTANEQRSTED